jgi:hypothetical protein
MILPIDRRKSKKPRKEEVIDEGIAEETARLSEMAGSEGICERPSAGI